jgi:ACS family glucarate transporter-like MFS transporter
MAGPCAYSITIDMGGRHVASVFSVMNMWGNIGATVFPFLVPLLTRLTGNWNSVLFLFAALYVVAAACWLPFNADRAIFDAEQR